MTLGRPPTRPWARAAASPAIVRWWIMSRSSSANAAMTGEEELALAGRGVRAGERAGQDAQADPVLVQFVRDGQDVLDRPAEAVELPHTTRVSPRRRYS